MKNKSYFSSSSSLSLSSCTLLYTHISCFSAGTSPHISSIRKYSKLCQSHWWLLFIHFHAILNFYEMLFWCFIYHCNMWFFLFICKKKRTQTHNIQERWKIDSGIGIPRDQFRDEASNVSRFIDDISLLVLLWLIL